MEGVFKKCQSIDSQPVYYFTNRPKYLFKTSPSIRRVTMSITGNQKKAHSSPSRRENRTYHRRKSNTDIESNFIIRIISGFFSKIPIRDESKKDCYGIAIFSFILLVMVIFFAPIPKYDELQDTKGKVIRISSKESSHSTIVNIELATSDGINKLVTNLCSRVRDVQEGDRIEAKVYEDYFGRKFYWIWELKANGEAMLSYDDVFNYNKWEADALTSLLGTVFIIYTVAGFLKKK